MYRFHQVADPNSSIGTSKLWISESQREQQFTKAGKFGEYMAWFRGALLQLFGEPVNDWSDATYNYLLEAIDDHGHTWRLTAYEGGSGPAIGGNQADLSIHPVAKYLQQLIDTTSPADFEETHYNDEYGTTTTYGCKGGVPYYYEARGRLRRATTDLQAVEYREYLDRLSRVVEEFGPDVCMSCEGSGKCHVCDGQGGIAQICTYDDAGKPILLPPPYPLCPECRGNGVCQVCGGAKILTADEE
jgi:hypothetical protein